MSDSRKARLSHLLRPRSIAIVGASKTSGSLGASLLENLLRAGFAGEIHLVNPKQSEIDGRPCFSSVDDLPEGIDCAVLAIPGGAVLPAIEACARRSVPACIIFSAGFAETGRDGRVLQEKVARIARAHDLLIEGPNCLGLVNYVDSIPLTFVNSEIRPPCQRAVGIVSQSGAMISVLEVSLRYHHVDISYSVSTGNEAVTGVEDYIEYLIDDPHTHVITLIVEQFRHPRRFLELSQSARARDKRIVLLHPGRTHAARVSAVTHTGAMANSDAIMRARVKGAGVALVNTIEELIDVTEMLVRFRTLPKAGPMILTESGAFKALALDFCEEIGLPIPALEGEPQAALSAILPKFVPATNPLDLTAQALVEPELYGKPLPTTLADDRFGSVVISLILTDEATSNLKFPPILDVLRTQAPKKPVIFAALDEGAQVAPAQINALRELGVPFLPSPERALRALAQVTRLGESPSVALAQEIPKDLPLIPGTLPEYRSKEMLSALGIPIPAGALARDLSEAQAMAAKIGFPVVLKAQAAKLARKSDANAVILGIAEEGSLVSAWQKLDESVRHAQPELVLDGVLVEKMAPAGLELIVGARNDPAWGPVLLIGFGGIQAEAIRDTRLFPADLPKAAIMEEFQKLRAAPLLRGFRGAPPVDIEAAAEVVVRVGSLVRLRPRLAEIDINPLVVYPTGEGALALDALFVVRES